SPTKPRPRTSTYVPPAIAPRPGVKPHTSSDPSNVYAPGSVARSSPRSTTTSTTPAVRAGVVTAIDPSELTMKSAGTPPNSTASTPSSSANPTPEIVTALPPVSGPTSGATPLIARSATYR